MKIKINILTSVVILLFTYCSPPQKLSVVDSIDGSWCLNKRQLNYPKLQFESNSTVTLSSLGDTLYRYKYSISGAYLSIEKDKKVFKSKIIKLTTDSLVLDKLLENSSIQRYYRCK